MAVSEDDGETWTDLRQIGDWGGIVVMGCLFERRPLPGTYGAMFHDDGRFIASNSKATSPVTFTLYKAMSSDGGLNWSKPETVASSTRKASM